MTDTGGDSQASVYVTIAEAADYIDAPVERIRQAVRDREIEAIKENPQNKRSRWLVRLDAVGDFVRSDRAETNGSPIERDRMASNTDNQKATPEQAEVLPVSGEKALKAVDDPQITREDWPESFIDGTAIMTISRGEELIERLSLSIDRFAESVPAEPFDYQGLMDRYVEAVERARASDVEAARLAERVRHLEQRLTQAHSDIDGLQATIRELADGIMTEEPGRQQPREPDTYLDRARPIWRRRARPTQSE